MPITVDLGPLLETRWKRAPIRARREIMAELYQIYRLLEDDDTPTLAPFANRQAAMTAPPAAPPPQPVVKPAPAGKPAQAQASLFDTPAATTKVAPDLTPRADNPFLPKSVLAKLQDSQAQASAQLKELMHAHENPPSLSRQNMEQELRLKLGPVIETLIEEHMQGLKSELRFRLRAEMDRLIATSLKKDG